MVKFFLIGFINTIFYYVTYAFFIYIGFSYPLAVFVAAIFGTLFSFKTFGTFVFENTNNKLIFKFTLVIVANYLINISIIYILTKYGYSYYSAGFFATLVVAFNSFFMNKRFVFRKEEKKQNE
jgi:putative flippase GtrA